MMKTLPTNRLRGILIIGLGCLALLTGCTMARLGYANADDLAYLWLDDQADFTTEQAPKVRQALVEMLTWHRRTQLPDYAQWLARAGADATRATTPQDVCKLGDDFGERIARMSDRLLPVASEVVLTFTDAQLAHMQARFDKGQAKFQGEYLGTSARQRDAAALKRAVSRAETLYGSIDDSQRAVLVQASKASPFDAQAMFDERAVRMRELIRIVKTARDAAVGPGVAATTASTAATQLQGALKQWLREGRVSPRAGYRAYQQRIKTYNCELSAQVHNAAEAPTRQRAVERLKGWEDDARALAGPSAS